MKLSELIDQELIFFNLPSLEKVDFLKKLISLIVEKKSHLNESIVSELIIKREELCSTALDNYIAIPHAKIPGIDKTYLSLGICDSGIAFESIDSLNTKIFIMILHPEETGNHHLEILKLVSNLFIKKDIVAEFLSIKDSEEIIKYIKDNE